MIKLITQKLAKFQYTQQKVSFQHKIHSRGFKSLNLQSKYWQVSSLCTYVHCPEQSEQYLHIFLKKQQCINWNQMYEKWDSLPFAGGMTGIKKQ